MSSIMVVFTTVDLRKMAFDSNIGLPNASFKERDVTKKPTIGYETAFLLLSRLLGNHYRDTQIITNVLCERFRSRLPAFVVINAVKSL